MKTPSRNQALLDLDYARELIEIATDHRVLAGTPDSSYMSNDEEIFYGPDGHSKCLEDARMIINDVLKRGEVPTLDPVDYEEAHMVCEYVDISGYIPHDVYDPRN